MKKILLSVVCLMMIGMQSVQAQVAIAALHHNDSVKIYSASGLQNAIDDAVAGDTIYLSEGIFGGFNVEKPIVIIGAGQTTSISDHVIIGKSSSTFFMEEGTLLSGMEISRMSFYGNVDGARIVKCKINGSISFSTSSTYSSSNIEILQSQVNTISLSSKNNSITIVSSKIKEISGNAADDGSATILNCNISIAGSTGTAKNNYVNCIIKNARSGIFTNCLYQDSNSYSVLYDCYENADFTLDDDLNCSLSDDELKAAGYVGVDNTWVGINGGEVQYSLVMPVVQVTEHSVEVDQAERKLKVSLKLGNK